jgi:hypothetical protein
MKKRFRRLSIILSRRKCSSPPLKSLRELGIIFKNKPSGFFAKLVGKVLKSFLNDSNVGELSRGLY